MSRELIIQDADDAINPVTKNSQETDFTDYLNNKLTPKSIYHSVNKIKYNNKFAVKFFDIRTQDYTDHVIVSNDGDFGWDSFHEVLTITIKRMHAGRYMITCNDALKTDKSSALNLLGESVKSDHYIWEYLIEIQTKTNT